VEEDEVLNKDLEIEGRGWKLRVKASIDI